MRTALVLLAGVATFLGGEAHRRTEKGNALYRDGAHDEALEQYGRAQALMPMAPELPYDLGNVLYRKENWAGAAEAYEKALSAAAGGLAPQAAYNLGNALFKDERYDDAVKAYVRALKGAPSDQDAKRNLELALRALEAQQQKQKKPQPNDQGEPKDDPKQPPQPKDGGDQGDKPQPQPRPGGMTPEEAQRLLDKVGEQEKQTLQKEKERRGAGPQPPRGKDW